jgi:hypothetical protein
MSQPPFRNEQPAEIIVFHAHEGRCRYCEGGIVKMRKTDQTLHPDQCWCIQCGQPYYVEFMGTAEEWNEEQWQQKATEER